MVEVRLRPILAGAAAWFLVACGGGSIAAAGEAGDAEGRIEALEKRVEKLEKSLAERDEEIARLRERLDEGPGAPGTPRFGPFRRRGGDPDMEAWRERMDDMLEELRKEFGGHGFKFGLPRSRPRGGPWVARRGAYLGIEMEPGPGGAGVVVSRVLPGTPAEEAGLEAGDEITDVHGRVITSPSDVVEAVSAREPGDEIEIAVLRDARPVTVRARLGERPGGGFGLFRWPPEAQEPEESPRPPAGRAIEVEVETPGGRIKVSLAAPGLHLTDGLARELGLTEDEARAVREAFAEAREGLAEEISRAIAKSGEAPDRAFLAAKRAEAERTARESLAGVLPEEKLAALEEAQRRLARSSSVSTSQEWTPGLVPGEEEEERRKDEPKKEKREDKPAPEPLKGPEPVGPVREF
jgi:hypothetical protein